MGKSKEIEGIEEYRKTVDKKNGLEPYKKSGQYQAVIESDKENARENNAQLDKEILENKEDNLKRRVQVYKTAVDEIKENIRLQEQDIKKLEEAKKNPEKLLNKSFDDDDQEYQRERKNKEEAIKKEKAKLDVPYLAYTQALGELEEFYRVKVDELKIKITDSEEDKAAEIGRKIDTLIQLIEEDKNLNSVLEKWQASAQRDGFSKQNATLNDIHSFYFNKLEENYPDSLALKILKTKDEKQKQKYQNEQAKKIKEIQENKQLKEDISKWEFKLYATEAQIWHNRAEELRELELKYKKPEIAESFFSRDDPSNKAVTKYEDAFRRAEEAKMKVKKLIKDTGGKESYLSNEIKKIVKDTGDKESFLYDCVRESKEKKQLTNEDYHKKIFESMNGLGERQQKANFLAYFIEFSTKQYISCKMTGAEKNFDQVCKELLVKAKENGSLVDLADKLQTNLDQYKGSLEKNFGHVNSNNIQLAIKKNESKEDRVRRAAEIEFENSDYRKISKKLNKLVDDSRDKNKEEKKKLMKDNFKEIFSALSKLNILPNLGVVDAWEKLKNHREKSKLTSSLKSLNIKDAHEIVKAIVPDARDKSNIKEK